MEIRQIQKEIDIRPASYLDENAENTEKYYLSLKCAKICCSSTSDIIWRLFYLLICFELHSEEIWSAETWNGIFFGHMLCSSFDRSDVPDTLNISFSEMDFVCRFLSICGNGDSTCRHCVIITQKTKNKRTMRRYITSIYIVNVLYF
jgi:hypothetical protein